MEGRGYIEENWVKKNVNTLIQSGMNLADGLLFAAMLAAGVLLLFNLNTFLMLWQGLRSGAV